jgi:hypothetical protein
MAKKRKKRTSLSPEWHTRHERTQRLLLERIAYHEAKREEARTGVPVEPRIRVPTSEEVQAQLAARLAQLDPDFRPYGPSTRKTTKKTRRRTPEEIARSAEIQQKLLERLAYHEAKLEEARTGVPVEPKIRIPTSEEVRERLLARIAYHEARLREGPGGSHTG